MKTQRLAPLYQAEGPFASVLIDVSHDTENGAHEHELRVRAATDALTELGADQAVVEMVAERLGDLVPDPSPIGRFVVANKETVVFDELVHTRVDQPVTAWSVLPDVAAWVAYQDSRTPFVLAVVDHEGGDVGLYDSDVPIAQDEASVGGETEHIHKASTADWSELRRQHVVENVWKRNADAVAEAIGSYVHAGHTLVLLAGDPRSTALVLEELGETRATVVQLDAGSRSKDGGEEALQHAISQALLDHAVQRRLEASHHLKDRLGRGEAVATGVNEVAEAFVLGQVDTLLLDPAAMTDLTLAPRDHPGLVLGVAPLDEPAPADQALLAAAALTGADVTVAPASSLAGAPVAALLRWDNG